MSEIGVINLRLQSWSIVRKFNWRSCLLASGILRKRIYKILRDDTCSREGKYSKILCQAENKGQTFEISRDFGRKPRLVWVFPKKSTSTNGFHDLFASNFLARHKVLLKSTYKSKYFKVHKTERHSSYFVCCNLSSFVTIKIISSLFLWKFKMTYGTKKLEI